MPTRWLERNVLEDVRAGILEGKWAVPAKHREVVQTIMWMISVHSPTSRTI
jgi:hypothetical protein